MRDIIEIVKKIEALVPSNHDDPVLRQQLCYVKQQALYIAPEVASRLWDYLAETLRNHLGPHRPGEWTGQVAKIMAGEEMNPTIQALYLLKLLREAEWGSFRQGQGSGFMSSGGDGPLVRCCPWCKGVDPTDPCKNHFIESAHGHAENCPAKEFLQ